MESVVLTQLTVPEVRGLFRQELERFFDLNTLNKSQEVPDRCSFQDALVITGLSKSKLYKLTASNEIPNKRFGSRLIFSRKELLLWLEAQTVDKGSNKSDLALAKSARNKRG